jgi:hypothetical protein
VGKKTSQQIARREGRFCPPEWQDWLFLAKNHF